jgi:hypothetical protein
MLSKHKKSNNNKQHTKKTNAAKKRILCKGSTPIYRPPDSALHQKGSGTDRADGVFTSKHTMILTSTKHIINKNKTFSHTCWAFPSRTSCCTRHLVSGGTTSRRAFFIRGHTFPSLGTMVLMNIANCDITLKAAERNVAGTRKVGSSTKHNHSDSNGREAVVVSHGTPGSSRP